MRHGASQAQQRRVLLLCDTDHHALLKAGREILSQVPKERFNSQSGGQRILGDFGVPEGTHIPKATRALKPEMATLSMGTLNFGDTIFENSEKTIRTISDTIVKNGIMPELEVFDYGMMNTIERYLKKESKRLKQ